MNIHFLRLPGIACGLMITAQAVAVESSGSAPQTVLHADAPPGVVQVEGGSTTQVRRLDTLKVQAVRVPRTSIQTVLAMEDMRHAPGSAGDPVNVIHTLPGVVTAVDGSGQMYMRGSGVNDNDVRVNGIPLPYLHHLGGLRSTINPMLIEDFHVFLGGFPVHHGDKLGGAIDVRLRAPRSDRTHRMLQLGTHEASLLWEGPVPGSDRDSYFVTGRRSYIDLLLSPQRLNQLNNSEEADGDDVIVTVPRYRDASLGWRRQLDHGSLEVLYMTAGDRVAAVLNENAESEPAMSGRLDRSIGYDVLGMRWESGLGDRMQRHLSISLSEYREEISFGSDGEGDRFFSNATVRTLRGQPELHWQPSPEQHVIFGGELEVQQSPLKLFVPQLAAPDEIDHDYTNAPIVRLERTLSGTSAAPFAQYQRSLGRWTIGAGLRYTDLRIDGGIAASGWSPRGSLAYRLGAATTLTASWSRHVQMADAAYLLPDIGNPGLRLTEAEHRIVGVRFDPNPQWSVQLEGYDKPMRRLVVGADETSQERYVNRGTGSSRGADLLIKHTADNGRSGWLSYSYATTDRASDVTGKRYRFEGDQPHTLNLVWSQPMSGRWSRWRWGMRVQASSGLPHTPVIGYQEQVLENGNTRYVPEYAPAYSERLPGFVRADLRLDRSIDWAGWQLNAYLDIHNVTARRNVIDYDYGHRFERVGNPRAVTGMPFMPFFGIEATF